MGLSGEFIKVVVAFVIFLIIINFLIFKLRRSLKRNLSNELNINDLSNLAGFGVATLLFYSSITTFITNFFSIITDLITQIPNVKFTVSEKIESSEKIIGDIINFPYGGVILFFSLWVIASVGLRQVLDYGKDDKTPLFNNQTVAKNVFIGFVVLFSIYLCIASIIAIPEFQALENTSVDNQEFQNFARSLVDSTMNNAVNNLKIELPKDIKFRYSSLQAHYSEVKSIVDNYNEVVVFLKNDLNNEKELITNDYQSAIEEKTASRERAKYKFRLKGWYLNQQQMVAEMALEKARIENKVNSQIYLMQSIDKDSTITSQRADLKFEDSYEDHISFKSFSTFYNNLGTYQKVAEKRPDRPDIGEQFGIFQSISGWLLKTESMSLALIVGLFAFGLLGAIGSSFIRQKNSEYKLSITSDYIPNLPVVMISGLSSAIIVFLAVKGAIVVFSTKDTNLNPYILFFTCLVAAVFSEDVWSWARKKLNENFNTHSKNNTHTNNGGDKV